MKYKHPALAGHESALRACLKTPKVVRESAKQPDVHMYPSGPVHLCVVVAPADGDERFVVTAYFTKNMKKGKELWAN
jgi:hypothetical protein